MVSMSYAYSRRPATLPPLAFLHHDSFHAISRSGTSRWSLQALDSHHMPSPSALANLQAQGVNVTMRKL